AVEGDQGSVRRPGRIGIVSRAACELDEVGVVMQPEQVEVRRRELAPAGLCALDDDAAVLAREDRRRGTSYFARGRERERGDDRDCKPSHTRRMRVRANAAVTREAARRGSAAGGGLEVRPALPQNEREGAGPCGAHPFSNRPRNY